MNEDELLKNLADSLEKGEKEDSKSDEIPKKKESSKNNEENDNKSAEEEGANESAEDEDNEPSEDENDEEKDNEDEDEKLHTIKINGKEQQLTLAELKERAEKSEGANQKFEEAAKARKEAIDTKAVTEAHHNSLQKGQQVLAQLLQSMKPPAADPRLIDHNPTAFLKMQEAEKAWQQHVHMITSALHEADQARQSGESQDSKAKLAQEKQKIVQIMPEWKDEKVRDNEENMIVNHLRGEGFNDDEINSLNDARHVKVVRDAALYRKSLADRQAAEKKLKAAPSGTTQSPKKTNSTNSNPRNNALSKLKKSGSLEDGANLLAISLKG